MGVEAPGGARSLFVRGVAYDVSDEQFTSHFSDVGPVARAFLVKEGKDGPHKGYGFVQFALASDAERAVQQLNGGMLGGRKLKVRWLLWWRAGASAVEVLATLLGVLHPGSFSSTAVGAPSHQCLHAFTGGDCKQACQL